MKVALITGGSRGIGAQTVSLFAKNGYTVILNYNKSQAQAQQLQAQLVQQGCDVHLYQADVSNHSQVVAMFAYVKRFFKKIDVLVNNAGVSHVGMCQDVSEQRFDAVMDTNAKGAFFCAQQALPLMGAGASIVNVSSIWGVQGASCESVYSMSKFAIVGLTKSLALELEPSGISVNCICPPIVATDMCKHLTEQDISSFSAQTNSRVYSATEVAQQVFNLATCGKTGVTLQLN